MKWVGITLGGLIVVLAVAAIGLHFFGLNRVNNAPDVTVVTVSVPSDAFAGAFPQRTAGRTDRPLQRSVVRPQSL